MRNCFKQRKTNTIFLFTLIKVIKWMQLIGSIFEKKLNFIQKHRQVVMENTNDVIV